MSIEFTGERVVPGQVDSDLWNEHLARYTYATSFCHGARVLDAGAGAGYGCAALASAARMSVGFDIAHEAVRFASGRYARQNTRWLQASLTALPFATASFDVVVAFEVIEHLTDWQTFLHETRRVLSDGGVFLVSTPNKSFYAESRESSGPNPFHTHEFEYDEFRTALEEVFPSVTLVLQNHAACVLFESHEAGEPRAHVEQASNPQDAHFFLAICSNRPRVPAAPSLVYVPVAANVLKERSEHIRRLEGELARKDEWLAQSQSEHAELVALHSAQKAELEASNTWGRQLDDQLKGSLNRIVALQSELEDTTKGFELELAKTQEELQARTQWAHDLEKQAIDCREQLARCVSLLDQAETTVIERTEWAQDLQRQLETANALLAGVKASRWIKLGKSIHMGPELPS